MRIGGSRSPLLVARQQQITHVQVRVTPDGTQDANVERHGDAARVYGLDSLLASSGWHSLMAKRSLGSAEAPGQNEVIPEAKRLIT